MSSSSCAVRSNGSTCNSQDSAIVAALQQCTHVGSAALYTYAVLPAMHCEHIQHSLTRDHPPSKHVTCSAVMSQGSLLTSRTCSMPAQWKQDYAAPGFNVIAAGVKAAEGIA